MSSSRPSNPSDLEQGAAIRVRLYRLAEERHVLVICLNHMVYDGTSFRLFYNDLERIHATLVAGKTPAEHRRTLTYADFVQHQATMLQDERGERLWSYWREKLAGELPIFALPGDFPRPAGKTYPRAVLGHPLDRQMVGDLKKIAAAGKGTLFMVLLAAYKVLLSRLTHQRDVIVGTPLEGRPGSEFFQVMGFFINMVALRSNLNGNPTFEQFLGHVRQTVLDAINHGEYPYPTLVGRLGIKHEDHQPLFQTAFIYQSWFSELDITESESESAENLFDVRREGFPSIHETGAYDLSLEILDTGEQVTAYFKYNGALYKESRIRRLADHFQVILEAIAEQPERRIGALPLMRPAQLKQIREDFNLAIPDRQLPVGTAHGLIEARADSDPLATAVAFEGKQLTYGELNRRANKLANYLISRGAGPDIPVGLCLDRSLDLAVGLLAILKAGSCYVPLDPNYPSERIRVMVESAAMPLIVTNAAFAEKLELPQEQTVGVDSHRAMIFRQGDANPMVAMTAANLAYIIFTSGSTGKPKGVLISHEAIVNYASGFAEHYRFGMEDRVLQFASINFDTAGEEIFPTWFQGGTLIFRTEDVGRSVTEFLDYLEKERITVVDLPTAFWHIWVDEMEDRDLPFPESVRLVIVGGEEAKTDRLAVWQARGRQQGIVDQHIRSHGRHHRRHLVRTRVFQTHPPLNRREEVHDKANAVPPGPTGGYDPDHPWPDRTADGGGPG